MNRRGFLQSMLALGVAPAILPSGIIMPVRRIVTTPAWPPGIPSDLIEAQEEFSRRVAVAMVFHMVDDVGQAHSLISKIYNARLDAGDTLHLATVPPRTTIKEVRFVDLFGREITSREAGLLALGVDQPRMHSLGAVSVRVVRAPPSTEDPR